MTETDRPATGFVVLGCAPLGNLYHPVDDAEADALVEAALAAGVSTFDTAPFYGSGLSESRLGRALERFDPGRTARVSTKVGRVLDAGEPDPVWVDVPRLAPRFDFSERGLRRSVAASQDRLRRERLDVALIHDPDDHVPQAVAEALPVLRELQAAGTVGAVGLGTTSVATAAAVLARADVDVLLLAGRCTLLDTSGLALLQDAACDVWLGGVFGSGLLARPDAGARLDYAPAPEQALAAARRWEALAMAHGVGLPGVALAFAAGQLAARAGGGALVVGAANRSELAQNLRALRAGVPAPLWQDAVAAGLLPASQVPVRDAGR